MELKIRKIGNSLGVIVPAALLSEWGLREGDVLRSAGGALRPPRRGGIPHSALVELKRRIALAVVRDFSTKQIRAQILANLSRWKRQGTWVSSYDEWARLASGRDDGELFEAMLGRDDASVQLRESPPFVGLLSEEEVRRLHEEAAA